MKGAPLFFDITFQFLVISSNNKTIRFPNKDQLQSIISNNCICNMNHNKNFLAPGLEHVITEDLNIVKDKGPYNIMTKGTKLRLPTCTDQDCIESWIN